MQSHSSLRVYEPGDTAGLGGWGVNQTAVTAVAFSGCPACTSFSFYMSCLPATPRTNSNL